MINQIITLNEVATVESGGSINSVYASLEGITAKDLDSLYNNASKWPILFIDRSAGYKYFNNGAGVVMTSPTGDKIYQYDCVAAAIQTMSGLTIKDLLGYDGNEDFSDSAAYFFIMT